MRERAVRVAGGDRVHQPLGQAARDPEDLRVHLARRQILRSIESLAAPSRVGRDDDDVGACGATRSPCTLAAIVDCSASIVMTPTMPTRRPPASTSTDGRTFGQATW